MSRTCQNCAHGQVAKDNEKFIECHFHAPQCVHGVGTGYENGKWPMMDYDEWCEDFSLHARRR